MASFGPTSIESSATGRRQRNRAEVIRLILDTSRQIMREEGAGALNLNEVARRMGIKTPSLYVYFPGKMAIYDALFSLGIKMYGEGLHRLLNEVHASPWDELGKVIEYYMSFAQQYPELYKIVFERPVPGFVPSEKSMEQSLTVLNEARQHMASLLASGAIETSLPTEQALDLMIAMMHGLASQHLANEPDLPIGTGRYGSLIPAAANLFRSAWSPEVTADE